MYFGGRGGKIDFGLEEVGGLWLWLWLCCVGLGWVGLG